MMILQTVAKMNSSSLRLSSHLSLLRGGVVRSVQGFGVAPGLRFYRRLPFVKPNLNELPVPEGSWERTNKRDNERYNKHLAFGVSFMIFTLFVVSRVATFNFYPPPMPGVIDDMCPVPEQPKKCA